MDGQSIVLQQHTNSDSEVLKQDSISNHDRGTCGAQYSKQVDQDELSARTLSEATAVLRDNHDTAIGQFEQRGLSERVQCHVSDVVLARLLKGSGFLPIRHGRRVL